MTLPRRENVCTFFLQCFVIHGVLALTGNTGRYAAHPFKRAASIQYVMTLSAWYTPILIGIDVLVVIYGLRVAFTENKIYGWFLALAFFLFGLKEVLPYNGIALPSTVALILSVAGLASALCAFYLLVKSLPS